MFYSLLSGTFLVTNSVLTKLTDDFQAAGKRGSTAEQICKLCETFEFLEGKIAPLFLLFFATSSSLVTVMSFSLYFYWGSISTVLNYSAGMMYSILLLFLCASAAEDCHAAARNLQLHLR
jgi:hypothetical protein